MRPLEKRSLPGEDGQWKLFCSGDAPLARGYLVSAASFFPLLFCSLIPIPVCQRDGGATTSESKATSLEYLLKNAVTLRTLVFTEILKGLHPAGDVYSSYRLKEKILINPSSTNPCIHLTRKNSAHFQRMAEYPWESQQSLRLCSSMSRTG